MFREELCYNCGMLFVFEKEDYHGFWMKNTLIPLDIIFIDSGFNIVDIIHAEPCITDNCEIYAPKKKRFMFWKLTSIGLVKGLLGKMLKLNIKSNK